MKKIKNKIEKKNIPKNFLYLNYNKKLLNNNNINLGYNVLKINLNTHNTLNTIYIGKKNKSLILNIKIIEKNLIKSFQIFINILKKNGKILIINTNPDLSNYTYNLKKKSIYKNMYFIDINYTKGNLTNYKKVFFNIKSFVNFYINYNYFLNYNKIHFAKYKKMKNNYKGFIYNVNNNIKKNITKQNIIQKNYLNKDWKPDLIILLSSINSETIVNEANKLNIPIIGFSEKNSSIKKITYPIPNNIYYYAIMNFFFNISYKIINKLYSKNK